MASKFLLLTLKAAWMLQDLKFALHVGHPFKGAFHSSMPEMSCENKEYFYFIIQSMLFLISAA